MSNELDPATEDPGAERLRLRAIVESAVDFAIVATNRAGDVTEWNSGAERILGWSAAEMRGEPVDRFFTPEDRAAGRPQEEMRISLRDGRANDERWHMRKDGSRFWASGEMMPIRDKAGKHLGWVKILRDFTPRRLERDRQLALHDLGERLRDETDPGAISRIAGEIVGAALDVRRVGYGEIKDDGETFVVPHDWTAEGFPSLAGTYRLADYGLYADDLRQGRTVVIDDLGTDPRTSGDPGPLRSLSVESLINHPVVERGRTVAILYVNDPGPREWRADEVAFVRDAADRIRQAVERRQAEQRLADEAARQRMLLQQMPGFVAVLSGPQHVFEYVNDAYITISGARDFVGRTVRQVFPELAAQGFYELLDKVYSSGERFEARSLPIRLSGEGRDRFIDLLYQPIRNASGGVTGIFVGGYDVTEQIRSQAALAESEVRYRTLFESIDVGFCIVEMKFDEAGRAVDYFIAEANPAFERQTGANVAGLWVSEFAPNLERHWFDTYGHVALTGEPAHFENRADVFGRWFDVRALRIGDPAAHRVAIFFADISERKSMEEALLQANTSLEERVAERTSELMLAEEQLRQSQKMEAVGQLTGGLAHDFNNLLAGITGSLELLGRRISQGRINDAERYVVAAQGAAKRAASLTHRLLAFSRRQTLDPKSTDVNMLVAGMDDLVRRTTGPEIAVELVPAPDLWPTLVDPNQLENALLNLCINARDAMPEGGKLIIETANRRLDQRGAQDLDAPPGHYVSLSVSDNGTGMPPEVIAKAFDPFFTTKPLGQGTGLGLSMIYGFVRQSGGQVSIYSEEGLGTTVTIYLPRNQGEAETDDAVPDLANAPRADAGETVLVVDDEPTVRMLVTEVLEELGYAAIEAADGASGLKVLQSDVRIDLLVSDVGLPGGMNGRQMADAGRVSRPDLKVLFITGYAENAVVGHGHLDPGMHVMTKPFALEALASRIKDLIRTT